MDLDAFEERAAIMEYDGGLSRFEAETFAAQAQGLKRWEVRNEISKRNSARGGNNRQADARHGTDGLSGVQPAPKEEKRSMPVGDVQGRRDSLALLALSEPGRGVL